jgi:hypothetical protein
MTRTAVSFAAAVGATASLVLAACGGGDGGLSREEFLSEADSICTEYDRRIQEIDEPQSIDDIERYADEAKPVIEEGMSELRELEPPNDLQEQWDEYIASSQESVEYLDELRQAGAAGDPARIQEIAQEVSQKNEEADRLARDLGLQDCTDEE